MTSTWSDGADRLQFVDLTVSHTKFTTYKMIGTVTSKHNGVWKDACRGDSGKTAFEYNLITN